MRRGALLVLGLALAGCGPGQAPPLPQWRVFLGTDAPLPQFADRLLVEILNANGQEACSGCRRQFGVTGATAWPLSFGVAPPPGDGPVLVRARLYRVAVTGPDGTPGSDRILDALVRLPSASSLSGVTDVGVALDMRCFGVPSDTEAGTTCDPSTSAAGPVPTAAPLADPSSLPLPGTWAPAKSVPCPSDPEAGMVCIPGGAFLLGNPEYVPLGTDVDPMPEQLVELSPFALDVDEMTVSQMRALVQKGAVTAPIGKLASDSIQRWCTYKDVGDDDLPVNCVTADQARLACAALGKRLPTEAEWEWAAGNLAQETPYPWGYPNTSTGANEPCGEAVVGNGDPNDPNQTFSFACVTNQTSPLGPLPVSATTTDLTQLPSMVQLRNMGGNVSELTSDKLQSYSGPECWGTSVVLRVNPTCGAGSVTSVRGGAWGDPPFSAGAFIRNGSTSPDPLTGFRCAK